MMVAHEGLLRPKDCLWAKIIEAENWRSAIQIAREAIINGDEGDALDSIPVRPMKM